MVHFLLFLHCVMENKSLWYSISWLTNKNMYFNSIIQQWFCFVIKLNYFLVEEDFSICVLFSIHFQSMTTLSSCCKILSRFCKDFPNNLQKMLISSILWPLHDHTGIFWPQHDHTSIFWSLNGHTGFSGRCMTVLVFL